MYFHKHDGYIISTMHNRRNKIGINMDLMFDSLSKQHAPSINQNIPTIGSNGTSK